MIFIYGTKGKVVLTERLENVDCRHCGAVNSLYGNIVSRHAHLFWIPFFPIGKKAVTVCTHCKQTLTEGKMPPEYKPETNKLMARARTPVWQFSGLILIGVFTVVPIVIGIVHRIAG